MGCILPLPILLIPFKPNYYTINLLTITRLCLTWCTHYRRINLQTQTEDDMKSMYTTTDNKEMLNSMVKQIRREGDELVRLKDVGKVV